MTRAHSRVEISSELSEYGPVLYREEAAAAAAADSNAGLGFQSVCSLINYCCWVPVDGRRSVQNGTTRTELDLRLLLFGERQVKSSFWCLCRSLDLQTWHTRRLVLMFTFVLSAGALVCNLLAHG